MMHKCLCVLGWLIFPNQQRLGHFFMLFSCDSADSHLGVKKVLCCQDTAVQGQPRAQGLQGVFGDRHSSRGVADTQRRTRLIRVQTLQVNVCQIGCAIPACTACTDSPLSQIRHISTAFNTGGQVDFATSCCHLARQPMQWCQQQWGSCTCHKSRNSSCLKHPMKVGQAIRLPHKAAELQTESCDCHTDKAYLATVTNRAEPSSSSNTLWILPLPNV